MALSLDVPFWPQLPNYSYYEDMYVQAGEHFPGIVLDLEKRTLRFSMDLFFSQIDRPRGIHLCGNPDWDFLFNLDLDVLSLDVYTNAEVFASYGPSIKKFLDRGAVIVWGIVPTGFEAFAQEEIPSLIQRLETIWKILWAKGIDREQMLARSMISPATCCLVNPDKEKTVERAFGAVRQMAKQLRQRYLKND
jgi:hypothetical protein